MGDLTMKYTALLLAILAAGCPDDDPPAVVAPGATIDSPAGTIDAAIDAPMSNVCTGLIYDRCTTNTQCMSGNCRPFNNLGYSLCTQVCVPGGAACPTQNGAAVPCTTGNSNVCRPTAGNACTAPP